MLIAQQFVSFLITEHTTFLHTRIGKRSEMAIVAMIYKKLSVISPATNKRFSSGQITNFINTDCRNLYFINLKLVQIVQIPVYIGFVVFLCFRFFGLYFFSGVAVLLLAVLTNAIMSSCLSRLSMKQMEKTD